MARLKKRLFSVVGTADPSPGPAGDADRAGSGAGGVGQFLRQARQRAQLDLPAVAEALRLRPAYIEAIEAGRFGDLPGSAYAVGFIRSYADFLHLDSAEIVRRFKEEVASLARSPELVFPAPVPEGRVPGGAILLIAVLLAVGAYGGWYYLSATDRSLVDLVPPLPDRFAALLRQEGAESAAAADSGAAESGAAGGAVRSSLFPAERIGGARTGEPRAPAADDAAESSDGSELPEPPAELVPAGPSGISMEPVAVAATPLGLTVPAGPAASDPVAGTGEAGRPAVAASAGTVAAIGRSSAAAALLGPAVPTAATGANPAAAAAPPSPPPAVSGETAGRRFGATSGASRIVLRATGASWVQVRDGQGRLVMTRVLQPGDSYAVPDMPGLRLDTGNAGGLAIEVDGSGVPAIGSKGEVVRNITLDAGRLSGGSAVQR